ncbi:Surp module [Aphelenchoides bicaudatus]|nr:Surp module [Aphelenchoides bicaudatus]
MMVPLIKPESVTFEPLKPSELRLPSQNLLTDRLKGEIDHFYSMLRNPPSADRFDKNGFEIKGLSEFYAIKKHHKRKLTEKMEASGKTFEDAITNRLVGHQLEQDKSLDPNESRPHSSSSSSSSSSYSSNKSRSPKQRFARSRSASPDHRPTFGGVAASFASPSSSGTFGAFKTPGLPLQREGNKGAQLLQKLGYSSGGLGSKGQGREEPIDAGNAIHPQDRFRGIGSKSDQYDDYRKRMSYSGR